MRFTLLVFVLLNLTFVEAQSLLLAFKGSVTNQELGKNESGVVVSIVQNGTTIVSATTSTNGKYSLKGSVDYKSPFYISFSKAGMVSKRININFSTMSGGDISEGAEFMPLSDLSMSVFSEKENVDFSFLNNEPVAVFNWNNSKAVLDLDRVAADKMKARIEKLLMQSENNNSTNDAKYQALIKEADNLYFNIKKYPEARSKYESALSLKPKEKYPSDKIVELDALISENIKQLQVSQQSDNEYKNLITAADALRDQRKYEQAIAKYKEASGKKNEQYPKDQVIAVQKLLDDQKKQSDIDLKYNEIIKVADVAFTQKKYTLAKEKYLLAKDIKPSEQLPVSRLAEIEKKLAEEIALIERKKKYEYLLATADKYFSERKWNDAKMKYSEALALDPTAIIPPDKIKECEQKIISEAKEKEKSDKIAKALADGNALFTSNKFNEARVKFNEVLVIDPQNAQAKQKLEEINLKAEGFAKSAEQEAKFYKLVSDGDLADKANKHIEAREKYKAALAVKSDPNVQQKLDEVIKKIKFQEDNALQEAKFKSLKLEGLKLFNEQKYSEASFKLNEALTLKQDVEISSKLKELENRQKQQDAAVKLDKEYQDLLSAAKSSEDKKNYDLAIEKYREASTKKPSEKFPREKIVELELLIKNESNKEELDVKYDALMKRGDELMNQQKYIEAIKEYNSALALKPTELLPVTKAKEAENAEKNKGSEDIKQYEKIISGIDKAIVEKDYVRGKELVERAKIFNKQFNIMSSDTRPNELMTKINSLEQADKNYAAKIAEGEKFIISKEYTKALASYEAAKIIKPSESVPTVKIEELKKIIAELTATLGKEQIFKDYMSKGASSQNTKNYLQALDNYQSALGIKPSDQLAQEKITEVKRLIEEQKNSAKSAQDKKERFGVLIAEADALFKSASYVASGAKYAEALAIDPSSNYAKKQLNESNRRKYTADTARSDEEFNSLVKLADDAFSTKSFEKAKDSYLKALDIKPNNPYVSSKVKEIDLILNPPIEKNISLDPLGKPFENSSMDGYAALQEAEILRKGNKDLAVDTKVLEVVRISQNLDQRQNIKNQSNTDKVSAIVDKSVMNQEMSDLNRRMAIQVFEKSQNDLAESQISDEGFKRAENQKAQEKLNFMFNESILDNEKRQTVYSENSETFQLKSTAQYESMVVKDVEEWNSSVRSAQRILLIEKRLQSEAGDDHESRAELRQWVNSKSLEVVKVEEDNNAAKREELLANNEQLFNSKIRITEKDVQVSHVAGTNNDLLKDVKSDVINKEQFILGQQVEHTSDLDHTISKMNSSISESEVDWDNNRLKSTTLIREGNTNVEELKTLTAKKENSKYLSNQSIIDGREAIRGEIEIKAVDNPKQNALNVELLDHKASSTSIDLNSSDDDERLQTRSKVEMAAGDMQDDMATDSKNRVAENLKIGDANKAIETSKSDLEAAEKNKNLSVQDKLSTLGNNKSQKVKLANSLGKEYPEGVSQETFTKSDEKGLVTTVITRRVVVQGEHGDVYVQTRNLQSVTYTKNGQPTTEMVWQRETQGAHLKKNY